MWTKEYDDQWISIQSQITLKIQVVAILSFIFMFYIAQLIWIDTDSVCECQSELDGGGSSGWAIESGAGGMKEIERIGTISK